MKRVFIRFSGFLLLAGMLFPGAANAGAPSLIKFEAVSLGQAVDITWSTDKEIGTGYYTIERSSDGHNFIEITRVSAAGQSITRLDYLEKDKDPLAGTSYYRLKHTDLNGEYTYSQDVVVKRRDCNGVFDILNATTQAVSTQAPMLLGFSAFGNEEYLVVMRDQAGNEFFSKVMLINDHGKMIAFDPEGKITKGNYVIIASSNDQLFTMNVVVE